MRDDDSDREAGEYSGPLDTPDDYEPEEQVQGHSDPSLMDDVVALFEDGKTYAEAEIAYQKSRAGFAANQLKGAVALIFAAFGVFHLALIALVVGLVIALVPIIGPWAATGLVTLALIIAGVILLRVLKGRIDAIRDAYSENDR
ncbi:phage holin family protein [Qipengyuania sp. XHP0207]|uniref:phage holin family protein n=1 Tax=Qipengyuania sp. XHP0207 TaxID=3038078 RepID=UPI00241DF897|nr:phage holin family protein [Qipengyuania sp. XHP0207]MDG5749431.1 phage holin family protein [Qipengyuania sp. XHP0207]